MILSSLAQVYRELMRPAILKCIAQRSGFASLKPENGWAVPGTSFKYPGIRSDSDMHVFSYSFKPWTYDKSISDAETILNYLNETAQEYAIEQHIQYNSPIDKIAWSTTKNVWTVFGHNEGNSIEVSCNFLMICTGYYDYDQGYTPNFKGLENIKADLFIHSNGPRISPMKIKR